MMKKIHILLLVIWIIIGILNFGIRKSIDMIDYGLLYAMFLVMIIRDTVIFWNCKGVSKDV